jgi:hypothetical protein
MAMLDLVFDGKTFPVPKKSVFELLDRNRTLIDATSYAVEVFEAFVDSLKTQMKISVTQGNAVSVWFLAKEFVLPKVSAECATFSVPADQFSRLFDRFSRMERQISSFTNPTRQIEDEIASQEEGLESLRLALEKVKSSVEGELGRLRNDLKHLQTTSRPPDSPSPPKVPNSPKSVPPQQPISNLSFPVPSTCYSPTKPSPSPSWLKPSPSPVPSPSPSPSHPPKVRNSPTLVPSPSSPKPSGSLTPSAAKSQNKVEIPMQEAKSLEGIISHLTQKQGGNAEQRELSQSLRSRFVMIIQSIL